MDPLIRGAASICVQDSTWPRLFEDCIGYVQMSWNSQVKLLFIQWYCQRMMKGCPTPFETHSMMLVPLPFSERRLDPYKKWSFVGGIRSISPGFCWVSERLKGFGEMRVPSFRSWEVWLEPPEGLVLWHHPDGLKSASTWDVLNGSPQ